MRGPLYQRLVEHSLGLIWAHDLDGTVLFVNPAAAQALGYTPEEGVGKNMSEFLTLDARHLFGDYLTRVREHPVDEGVMRVVDRLGRERLWKYRNVRSEEPGELPYVVGHAVDVTELKQAEEVRLRLAAIVESSDDAIISMTLDGVISTWNSAAQRLFGYSAEEAVGQLITITIPPELYDEVQDILRRLRAGERIEHHETRRVSRDGRYLGVSLTISPIRDAGGTIIGASKIARDITDRKRSEGALRASEERFRLMADTAPVMVWMSGLDKLCTYFNRPWLEFTGRPIEAELGNGWAEAVHPGDLTRCMETYIQAFERRQPFTMEYRLRRHDGEYRWILDSGVPMFVPDGSFGGYIGSAIDVTDQRLAREALSNLSRNLMEAQEKERASIARELHDDLAQRMVGLALQLQSLVQVLPHGTNERVRAEEICNQATDLVKDIPGIAHRLHSSSLEHLGIVPAAADLCRELSELHEVDIDFIHDSIPDDLPQDVALALFRVLQEALNNAVKHSGVRRFKVVLRGARDEIQLEVTDSGIGFDPWAVMRSHGLGLVSMQERLGLVDGEIFFDSRPGAGTTVRVQVPLEPD